LDAAGNKSKGAEVTWVTYEDPEPETFLASFGFSSALNPGLPASLTEARRPSASNIDIQYHVPVVLDDLAALVPVFEANGKVYAEGSEVASAVTALDFSRNVALVVRKPNGRERTYQVTINTPQTTGLPMVLIETRNGVSVDSKDEYVEASFSIVSEGRVVHQGTTRIKGRGNATWSYPKKPYRLKLDAAQNLLSIMKTGSAKNWVLLANYCDETLLRTTVALWLGDRPGVRLDPAVGARRAAPERQFPRELRIDRVRGAVGRPGRYPRGHRISLRKGQLLELGAGLFRGGAGGVFHVQAPRPR